MGQYILYLNVKTVSIVTVCYIDSFAEAKLRFNLTIVKLII